MDQSKKTMRHFYCRDVLWETFEQMANDFDCSIDYLINESMRYYARSKNYPSVGAQPGQGPGQGAGPQASMPPAPQHPAAGQSPVAVPRRPPPAPAPQPVPVQAPPSAPPQARRPAPPPQPAPMQGMQGGPAPQAGQRPGYAPPPPSYPPAAAPAPERAAPAGAAGQQLFLVFSGQRYPVGKDQFIIGRGSKTSDLPIKDGNISRKHAAVIRRNGTFYIKDLGSTNGIEYKGMRIDNKRIDEGDVFHLCDYELRFTYRAD
jgi:hypothetical protein